MTWRENAQQQHGSVDRAQMWADGVGRHALARLVRTGELVARVRGVYTVAGSPETVMQRVWVASLATRGVIGYRTAAALWQVIEEPIGAVDVVVAHSTRIQAPPGVRVHRTVVPRQETTRLDGLLVTSRRWTPLDVLAHARPEEGLRLADRALQQRWVTREDLTARLEAYPGRRGNRLCGASRSSPGTGRRRDPSGCCTASCGTPA